MRHLILPALIASGAILSAQSPQPSGHWEGAIELPGTALKVLVDLTQTKDGWTGKVSIPQQGAKDLALEKVQVNGKSVTFVLPGVPGDPTFKGELSPDGATLSGQFTQGGQSIPFKLAREAKGADKARQALAGFEAEVEKIRADWKVPGLAIAIVKNGEVIYAKGHGMRAPPRPSPPLSWPPWWMKESWIGKSPSAPGSPGSSCRIPWPQTA